MVEVFYGTSVPEQQRDEKTEYYTRTYMFVPPESFVVMQIHGWRQPSRRPTIGFRAIGRMQLRTGFSYT
jgi:hypothetical protein